MKLNELHEGMMKRSDPYISGEKSGPRPPAQPAKPTQPAKPVSAKPAPGAKLQHDQKIDALSKKARVPREEVEKAWNEERDKVDSRNPQRWAIVMNNVKKRLRVS
jgi:hypothetical protein